MKLLAPNPLKPDLWSLCQCLGIAYHQLGAALSCLSVPLGVQKNLPLGYDSARALEHFDSILAISFIFACQEEGHVCIPLANFYLLWQKALDKAQMQSPDVQLRAPSLVPDCFDTAAMRQICQQLSYQELCLHWADTSAQNSAISAGQKPLLLVTDRAGQVWCHSHASFVFETRVVKRIRRLLELNRLGKNRPSSAGGNNEVVLKHASHLDNDQLQACQSFGRQHFALLTGGPGTGKTSTAFFMLWNWWQSFVAHNGRQPHIKLSAPTGRAAARLAESLAKARASIHERNDDGFLAWIDQEKPVTVHSLLYGAQQRAQPLAQIDLLLIDEASMLALSLMAKVLDVLPDSGGLLLLGDPDQLPSIDAGAIVADLAGQETHTKPSSAAANDFIHRLSICHRSNQSISDAAAQIRSGVIPDLPLWDPDNHLSPGVFLARPDSNLLSKTFCSALGSIQDQTSRLASPAELLARYGQVAILSPQKEGPLGTKTLNRSIIRNLKLTNDDGYNDVSPCVGLSVLIKKNNPRWNLSNGDRGVLAKSSSNELCFFANSGQDQGIPVSLLDEWEAGFAMTVHKSQGSEYPLILLAVPDTAANWASRELLYTALTRASRQVVIFSDQATLQAIVNRRTQRFSLLSQALLADQSDQTS